MLINSHYPQVPLATSNVATDLARVDNQQKPPIIPPQQPTQNHPERAYNPQNERVPAYKIVEQKQQQQHANNQQQTAQQAIPSQPVRVIASNTPTIQRKDIRIKLATSAQTETTTPENKKAANHASTQDAAYFQLVRQHVSQYYGQHKT
ncbi:hypothetical protein [Shewanella subflava]|uniref:Uncharacterized protein n=1 Tax=Shewanella subflava TaxID=2986476 RepID=A0ABT3I7S0_9GAMM|nr:hypothetical protein [Shewanella subflava]MCW3172114.1 hypothetical protein [Shewanella subflava]